MKHLGFHITLKVCHCRPDPPDLPGAALHTPLPVINLQAFLVSYWSLTRCLSVSSYLCWYNQVAQTQTQTCRCGFDQWYDVECPYQLHCETYKWHNLATCKIQTVGSLTRKVTKILHSQNTFNTNVCLSVFSLFSDQRVEPEARVTAKKMSSRHTRLPI